MCNSFSFLCPDSDFILSGTLPSYNIFFRLRRNHTLIYWILFIKQNCLVISLFNMKVNTNFFMILFEIFFLENMPIWWKLESYLTMDLNVYPALNLSKPIMTSLRKWWVSQGILGNLGCSDKTFFLGIFQSSPRWWFVKWFVKFAHWHRWRRDCQTSYSICKL